MKLCVEVLPLSSSTWAPPALPALCPWLDVGRKTSCWAVGNRPLVGHRTQMQGGSRRSSENSQQLCEPPEATWPLWLAKSKVGLHPHLSALRAYTKNHLNYNSLQFGDIYTRATNQDSERLQHWFVGSSAPSIEMIPCNTKHPQGGFQRLKELDTLTFTLLRCSVITSWLFCFSISYPYPKNTVSKVDGSLGSVKLIWCKAAVLPYPSPLPDFCSPKL